LDLIANLRPAETPVGVLRHVLSLDLLLSEAEHSLLLLAVGQAWQKISEESPGDNNWLLR